MIVIAVAFLFFFPAIEAGNFVLRGNLCIQPKVGDEFQHSVAYTDDPVSFMRNNFYCYEEPSLSLYACERRETELTPVSCFSASLVGFLGFSSFDYPSGVYFFALDTMLDDVLNSFCFDTPGSFPPLGVMKSKSNDIGGFFLVNGTYLEGFRFTEVTATPRLVPPNASLRRGIMNEQLKSKSPGSAVQEIPRVHSPANASFYVEGKMFLYNIEFEGKFPQFLVRTMDPNPFISQGFSCSGPSPSNSFECLRKGSESTPIVTEIVAKYTYFEYSSGDGCYTTIDVSNPAPTPFDFTTFGTCQGLLGINQQGNSISMFAEGHFGFYLDPFVVAPF